jgi:hypothetical protein
MHEFTRSAPSYSACLPPYPADAGLPQNPPNASLVAITEIEPVIRHLKDGIPDAPIFASRERLLRILRGIKNNEQIPPIWLFANADGCYPYKIHQGVHRFYASMAAGFTHIPALIVAPFVW